MNYYELEFKFTTDIPKDTVGDILSAELGEIGFESFGESENGIFAYISSALYKKEEVDNRLLAFPVEGVSFEYSARFIEGKDWNEEWEKNYFKPIKIGNECVIRASFHQGEPGFAHTILIDPKMAFGTGNHETTRLMIGELLNNDISGKTVLDMGCGTAVLAILARMRGASSVTAIDIDEWAYENALENIRLNNVSEIEVRLGGAEKITEKDSFDVVLANINRNILLNDIKEYAKVMKENALLFMSGFYVEDIKVIEEESNNNGMILISKSEANNWAAVIMKKCEN